MFISLTSFRKGLGQTVTSINISAMLSKMMNDNVLLIDTNTENYMDVQYYLSNALLTKGLDEFMNLRKTSLLKDKNSLFYCVKNVKDKFDIMGSNQCFELTNKDIKELKYYTGCQYKITMIDTVASSSHTTEMFLDNSEVVLVIINQQKKVIDEMVNNSFLKKYKDKIIFVINRYIEKVNNKKILYKYDDIQKDLVVAGFNNPLFKLSFDVELLNDCNDSTLLSYTFNKSNINNEYYMELESLSKHLLTNYLGYSFEEEINTNKNIFKKALKCFQF